MNTALQIEEKSTPEHLQKWVNPEPVEADLIPKKTAMVVVPVIKPALITDSETGKLLAASSFARGDALLVEKPEQLGLCKPQVLPILGYSYDDRSEIYAITKGPMPNQFRNALTMPGATEVLFCELPATIHEIGIKDYKDAFKLRRVSEYPEFDKRNGQIKIDFNQNAA